MRSLEESCNKLALGSRETEENDQTEPDDEDINEAAKKEAIDSIEFRRNAVPVLFVITSILWIVVLFLARGEYKQAKKLGADYKFGSSTQDYGSTMNKKRQSLMNKVSSDGKARYKRRL